MRVAQALEAHGDVTLAPRIDALYTELDVTEGVRWARGTCSTATSPHGRRRRRGPIELAFMTGGALALGDRDAAAVLRPLLTTYAGMNLVGGQFVAVFGSADRYLAQVAALLGDADAAERHFAAALAMDRHMGLVGAHRRDSCRPRPALHPTDPVRAQRLAAEARALAEPIGQVRVLRRLERLRRSPRPVNLTARRWRRSPRLRA